MSVPSTDEVNLNADEFESSWQTGIPPSLREFFEQRCRQSSALSDDQRSRLLINLVKVDLLYRWKTSRRRTNGPKRPSAPVTSAPTIIDQPALRLVEDTINEFDDVTLEENGLLELITQEYRVRHEWGDQPDIESYVRRFRHMADQVRDRLNDYRKILSIEASIKHLFESSEPNSDSRLVERIAETAPPPERHAILALAQEETLLEVLSDIVPFRELSTKVQQELVDCATERTFEAGEILLRQGEVSDCLLIILEGVAEVTIDDAGETHRIARVGRRTVIGEIGMVTKEVRSANIRALTDVHAAIIAKDDFEKLVGKYPTLSIALSELIAERVGTLTIDVLCGKTINGYYVKHRLGRGSMGIVYKAIDTARGCEVALKMLRHDLTFNRQATQRFQREAEIVQALDHPNIVHVFGQFEAYHTNFIAMEFCDGPTLSQFIQVHGALPVHVTKAILGQLAAALLCAHEAEVAHRDLKPANVMLQRDGVIKLTDFGLARYVSVQHSSLTGLGQILGTPRYMAPEQLGGDRGDSRVDLYALGCVTWELITGGPLFPARRFDELMRQRFRWSFPPVEEIPGDLDEDLYSLMAQCLTDDPEDRVFQLSSICSWAALIDPAMLTVPELDDPDGQQEPSSTVDTDEG